MEFILKHEKRLSRPITASTNGEFADPLLAQYDFFKSELSSDELNRYLEATHKRKVILIVGIYSGSTAANIGLQPGDRILSVNGEPIFSPQYTMSQINTVPPGVVIPIEIRRPGSTSSETLYIPGGRLGIEAQLQSWQ
ncbi:PDZ domain-containing protein [Microbulbifer pacificus]|uniref:PDZ domain-containing protein n=1 Tax=Microbulbifer pacificus TaxID=407164 RepID=A0AAU0N1D6_9GAMM|nr:PDZ domain-containing protein [Microbulbifer pacificus]WOX06077.1 PDZ domain-containing protein [Microbulbifer pacificus]